MKKRARVHAFASGVLPPSLRMEVRLRNNRLIKAREAHGLMSGAALARATGLTVSTCCEYESLKTRPHRGPRFDYAWRTSALRIAKHLGVLPDDLWPEALERVAQTRLDFEMDAPAVAALEAPPAPDLALESSEMKAAVVRALGTLSPHERAVVETRFGLIDGVEHTRSEVADLVQRERDGWRVSTSRVDQLEKRALDKLGKVLKKVVYDE